MVAQQISSIFLENNLAICTEATKKLSLPFDLLISLWGKGLKETIQKWLLKNVHTGDIFNDEKNIIDPNG